MGSLRTANTKHNRAVTFAVKADKAAKAAPAKTTKAKKAA